MALLRRNAPARISSKGSVEQGFGSDPVKVKGKRATARQRDVLDGVLQQCRKDNVARRVAIAAVMTVTQESRAGEDSSNLFQQERAWTAHPGDPAKATHAFLITGPSSWKKVHGSIARAPGNLSRAINEVQRSAFPDAYAKWEKEATRTVDSWLREGGDGEGSFATEVFIKRYTFTRGERHGQQENSWDAAQRLLDEVGAYRWAANNVFFAVSGDELRKQKSSLTIDGNEGWIRSGPAWSWGADRAMSEVTLEVLADRWDVIPGGLVVLHPDLGAMSGNWLVWNISGNRLDGPEVTVVLRRPTRLKNEPASEFVSRGGGGDVPGVPGVPGMRLDASEGVKTAERLLAVCKEISRNRSPYLYGGGHGPAVKRLRSSTRLDCSSSVSLALYRAGFLSGEKPALVSGGFMSWAESGEGDDFTVWANPTHVWIEFSDGSRFDTSQHGGASGPMYTTVKRSSSGFTPRHYRGN